MIIYPPFSKAQDAFDDNFQPIDWHTEKSTDRLLAAFEWYARTLKAAREQGTPY